MGAISASSACIGLSFIVDRYTPKMLVARVNGLPAASRAAMVLANVAASLAPAMAAISVRCRSMAFNSAGLMSVGLIRSKRGKPPCGPVQVESKGSSVTPGAPFASRDVPGNATTPAAVAVVMNVRRCMDER